MRSSKSRSRSKPNRQRSMGNIVNRVFDSSGPEGKVRGTPQQIIDKYLMLARDAQLSNDRVAEQSFYQHAEHYTRMLGEAQREMAREQEARQQQHQQNQQGQGGGQSGQDGTNGGDQQGGGGRDQQQARDDRRDGRRDGRRDSGPADVIDIGEDSGSSLVDTPEAGASQPQEAGQADRPRREPRPRGPRRPRNAAATDEDTSEKNPAAE